MESFIVSARKYRPQTFDMVVGQNTIITTLKNAIKNNQIAQSFLFCGPRGVGKTTCARILAKTINCQNITPQYEACNECPSCLSFNQTASFNMHELDAASNNSVDDIRNLVDQVRIPPQAGKYKVYIIDEVHMLSSSAFNAFLKTLEEPPSYAKFILATTEKHKIIPTILSRCQIFDFRRITVNDIAQYLEYVSGKEGIKADSDALHIIAQKSDGALRDALSIFDQIASSTEGNITYQSVLDNLNILDYDFYFTMTGNISRGNTTETLLLIEEIIDNGFDGQQFINGFSSHLRNLLICKNEQTIPLLEVSDNIRDRYLEQVRSIPVEFILRSLDIANQCEVTYKTSNNKRLQLELAFIHMCMLTSQPADTAQGLAQQEKKTPDLNTGNPEVEKTKNAETIEKAQPKPKAVFNKAEIISIKNFENAKNKQAQVAEPEEDYGNQNYTESELLVAFANYANTIKDTRPHLFSTMTRREPVIRENNLIELIVDNKVQQDEVTARRSDILNCLRRELKNSRISIETVVIEQNDEKKHLSPEQKFAVMAEKNPALKYIKDKLDLEIDY
jgi:DNA polymerase III subunit gamma/tau